MSFQVWRVNANRLKTNSFQMIRETKNFCSPSYQHPYANCQACTIRIQSKTYYRIKASNCGYGIKKHNTIHVVKSCACTNTLKLSGRDAFSWQLNKYVHTEPEARIRQLI